MQKIKGAKVSVADSRPFATPSRSLSRRTRRTAFVVNTADSAQTEPCAPIRDKFAFGKFCFLSFNSAFSVSLIPVFSMIAYKCNRRLRAPIVYFNLSSLSKSFMLILTIFPKPFFYQLSFFIKQSSISIDISVFKFSVIIRSVRKIIFSNSFF